MKLPRVAFLLLVLFLLAPLPREAGGSGRCGKPVFQDRKDPDYQAILAVFRPVAEQLARVPRLDMPGGKPSDKVSRCTQ